MHYISEPSIDLLIELKNVFNEEMQVLFKTDWLSLHKDFNLIYWNDYKMNNVILATQDEIYTLFENNYQGSIPKETLMNCTKAANIKNQQYENVFIQNRKHLKYHIAIFQK